MRISIEKDIIAVYFRVYPQNFNESNLSRLEICHFIRFNGYFQSMICDSIDHTAVVQKMFFRTVAVIRKYLFEVLGLIVVKNENEKLTRCRDMIVQNSNYG